jgi:hypothetical protein
LPIDKDGQIPLVNNIKNVQIVELLGTIREGEVYARNRLIDQSVLMIISMPIRTNSMTSI